MIPYRGIVVALGIATHDNVPKVVIISQEGSEPRDIHPWEASNFFSRDVIEKAKLIPLDELRLRREIKETARLNGDFELYELGKFFATWMISQGGVRVNTMQCTAERVQSWLSVIGLLA